MSRSFMEQVRLSLAREPGALRPTAQPVRERSFWSHLVAALARMPAATMSAEAESRPQHAMPQADPAQGSAVGPTLAAATVGWKSVSPQDRFRRRSAVLEVAEELKGAAALAAPDLAHAHALDRARDLDRAQGLAHSLAEALDLTRSLSRRRAVALARRLATELVPTLDRALDLDPALDPALHRALDHTLAIALTLDPALHRAFDHALDRTRALALAVVLDPELERDRDRARTLSLALARDLPLALGPARAINLSTDIARDGARIRVANSAGALVDALASIRALTVARDITLARDLEADLIKAHDNLTAAANDFTGADLSAVDPASFDLAGIRWDSDTQWPSPEWTARIYRASVESPPGSGVLVVQPEEGHSLADSPMPIS